VAKKKEGLISPSSGKKRKCVTVCVEKNGILTDKEEREKGRGSTSWLKRKEKWTFLGRFEDGEVQNIEKRGEDEKRRVNNGE